MRRNAVVLALVLALAPQVASGADLVVWWEQAFYPQADEAVREIVAAFEQETGKRVELVQPSQDEIMKQAESALQAGAPPDFLFSTVIERDAAKWAYEDRLVDLEGVLGPVLDLFDADTIEVSTLLDGKTGRRGLYALPMGRISNHIHVWNSLLERAGFSLADIPQGVGGVLVVLVRSRAAGGAQGARPRGHLGGRPADVGRRERRHRN